MKKASPLFVILAAISAQAAADLTPVTGERVLDGVKFPQLIFREGDRQITYEHPRGWKYVGDSSRITFTPPDVIQAEAVIEQSALPAPQNFDDQTIKTLQKQILASVPANSQEVALVSAEKNPLKVGGHETFEVIVGYQLHGVEFQRSVLFLNLSDTQLRFRTTARKADFAKVHKAFRGSIYSWQWQ